MPSWDKEAILAEIRREIGWTYSTVDRLQQERQQMEAANKRLLDRRKNYLAKGNGKGRPPKKLQVFSREKQLTLTRNKIEYLFLAKLEPALSETEKPLVVLEAELKKISPSPNVVELIHARKLRMLLDKFRQCAQPILQP